MHTSTCPCGGSVVPKGVKCGRLVLGFLNTKMKEAVYSKDDIKIRV